MIKRISLLVVVALIGGVLVGCGPKEDDVKVPVGKPGDGGPQPSGLSAAGGTAPAAPAANTPASGGAAPAATQ